MAITLRMTDAETELVKNYASLKGVTVSEVVRRAVMEKIEDDIDLAAYERAMAEYRSNPVSYSQDEVERILGLR